MSKITFDSDEISKLCKTATGLGFDPKADEALTKLLDIKDQLDNFIEKVKETITKNALAEDANFTALKTDHFKVEYRAYGALYRLVDADAVPEGLLVIEETTIRKLVPDAITEYIEKNGGLPAGVEYADRKKQLTIKRK